jgi:hypothetical protein
MCLPESKGVWEMAVDEAAILKRAKELCEQNGTAWDLDYSPAKPGVKIRLALNEAGRREYLARAREELASEGGDA